MVTEMLDNCKSTVYGSPHGRTALHAAVLAGDEKTVRKLIEAKMQLTRQTNDNGRTPLHYAAHFGKRSIAKVLLEKDASAAYISDKERGMSEWWTKEAGIFFTLLSLQNLFDEKDANGYTPIHIYFAGPAHRELQVKGWKSWQFSDQMTRKKKHIRQLLNDIGDNAEVEGLLVHPYFRIKRDPFIGGNACSNRNIAAAFTVPGGYNSDEQGDATLSRDPAFKAFIITDTLAFVSSLLAVLLHFLLVFLKWSLVSLRFQVIGLADVLTFSAMIAMVIAFSTGSYAVLQSSMGFAIATCSIGLTFIPGATISSCHPNALPSTKWQPMKHPIIIVGIDGKETIVNLKAKNIPIALNDIKILQENFSEDPLKLWKRSPRYCELTLQSPKEIVRDHIISKIRDFSEELDNIK
ncbi:uncharacterized protein LOC111279449 [Durio zibethinus]|uniref:Uncharacterized protein LOC111279449 n=1 Tax=Durio zibethinus TaxID=66656 RepID=A0A6P5X2V8_DURZI|nr:uncharacterized protein LOC111279449 [Durio zibethinus]